MSEDHTNDKEVNFRLDPFSVRSLKTVFSQYYYVLLIFSGIGIIIGWLLVEEKNSFFPKGATSLEKRVMYVKSSPVLSDNMSFFLGMFKDGVGIKETEIDHFGFKRSLKGFKNFEYQSVNTSVYKISVTFSDSISFDSFKNNFLYFFNKNKKIKEFYPRNKDKLIAQKKHLENAVNYIKKKISSRNTLKTSVDKLLKVKLHDLKISLREYDELLNPTPVTVLKDYKVLIDPKSKSASSRAIFFSVFIISLFLGYFVAFLISKK